MTKKENRKKVEGFFRRIEGEKRRNDCIAIVELMAKATGKEPVMWTPNVVGYGKYHYINKLDDVHIPTLRELVKKSTAVMARAHN